MTYNEVINNLKKYHDLEMELMRLRVKLQHLKSPAINNDNSTGVKSDMLDTIMKMDTIRKEMSEIEALIEIVPTGLSKLVLQYSYLNHYRQQVVCNKLFISRATYFRLKKEGINYIANHTSG